LAFLVTSGEAVELEDEAVEEARVLFACRYAPLADSDDAITDAGTTIAVPPRGTVTVEEDEAAVVEVELVLAPFSDDGKACDGDTPVAPSFLYRRLHS